MPILAKLLNVDLRSRSLVDARAVAAEVLIERQTFVREPQQLRQLGDVGGDPPRLVAGQHVCGWCGVGWSTSSARSLRDVKH